MTLLHRLILLAMIVIVPIAGVEVHDALSLREGRTTDLRDQASRLAARIQDEQFELVEHIRDLLETIAAMDPVHKGDAAGCNAALGRLRDRYPARISVSGGDGRVWCSTDPDDVGASVGDQPHLREAAKSGGFAIGSLVRHPNGGRPALPLALGYRDAAGTTGNTVSALVGADRLAARLIPRPIPSGVQVIVADRAGAIMLAVPEMPGLIGEPLPAEYGRHLRPGKSSGSIRTVESGEGGGRRLVSITPAGDGPDALSIAVALDLNRTPSVIDPALTLPASIVLLLVATAGLMVWGAQVFIRRPVSVLIDTTRRWRSGDLSARAGLGRFGSELAELGRAFDEMAEDLQDKAQAAAAAHAAAHRMAAVLESTTDCVFEVDRDWRITVMNQRCRVLLAGGREVVGQCLWTALDETVGGLFELQLRRAMREGSAVEFETRHDMLGIWVAVRAFPSREGLAVYLQDVTGRRMAEEEQRRLRRELETERVLLQAVVQHMPSGLVVADAASGKLILQNEKALDLLGHSVMDADGLERGGAVHPDGTPYQPREHAIARALRQGAVVDQEEVLYRRGDGTLTTMAVNAAPVCDSAGGIILAVCTFHDISQRKAMEEALRDSETRLNLALAAAQAGIWDWDIPSGRIAWSQELYRLRGFTPDQGEITYDRWIASIHPDDQGYVAGVVTDTLKERRSDYVVEFRINHPDRGLRWIASIGRASYGPDGTPLRMVGLNIDVTERRTVEDALRSAKETSERANLAKSKFLAAASHDLRQPLQSMFLFAGALKAKIRSAEGREMLVHLERGLDALKGLLDSLLDISKLDAGLVRPEIGEFPIQVLLSEMDSTYGTILRGKRIGWRVESCEAVVRSDRTLLARMVRNLVENAVRYTESGEVVLTCAVAGDDLRIAVRDTGIGIPADQMDAVFEEFHQIGNPERDRQQGLGLGLAIVRRLSQLLGHPVEVRSEPGKGSTFTITVPASRAAAGTGDATDASKAPGAGRLAVVVDDEAMVLIGLRALLVQWGYDVLIAGSGPEAVERVLASGRTPAVVIADYRLRGGEIGTDVVLAIRAATGGAGVPGIILTGETGPESLQSAQEHGLPVIHKPVTLRQLAAALEREGVDRGLVETV